MMLPNRRPFAEGAVHQDFQASPLCAIPRDGHLQPVHREAEPRCLPLAYERLYWTPEQYRFAAAVLGDHARHLVVVLRDLAQRHPERTESPYANGMDHEMAREAGDLARLAWHYASLALEANEQAAQTFDGVVR